MTLRDRIASLGRCIDVLFCWALGRTPGAGRPAGATRARCPHDGRTCPDHAVVDQAAAGTRQ